MATSNVMGAGGIAPAMASSLPIGSTLPHFTQGNELQKLLSDERKRSEQHKKNYQQLKVEHSKLQDEYLSMQREVKTTIEEGRIVQEKYKSMYEACSQKISEQQAELDECQSRILTPRKLEEIHYQAHDKVEASYRMRYQKQEQETKDTRDTVTKLRYELSFLKAEFEHDRQDYARQVQEMKMQHDVEVANLRKERDATIYSIQAESHHDTENLRQLQRENLISDIRVKALLAEVDDLRSEKEKACLDADSVHRSLDKQISELQASVRCLEVERESLQRQSETYQQELASRGNEQGQLRSRVHELEHSLAASQGQRDELSHCSQVQMSDLKLEMSRQRSDLERERDKLANTVQDLKMQVEICDQKIVQLHATLDDKQREIVQRVFEARQEEFVKLTKVENEKYELETKVQEMERRRMEEAARVQANRERQEVKVQQALSEKGQVEREAIGLRARMENFETLPGVLERERGENVDLRSKVKQLDVELSAAVSQKQALSEQTMRLRNEAELSRKEAVLCRKQLLDLQTNHDAILAQQRASLQDGRQQAKSRVAELECRLTSLHAKFDKAAAVHKKLKKRHTRLTEHLQDKVSLLKAKNEALDVEKQALQQCVPIDQHIRLKRQWKDLYRRHQEFCNIIQGRNQRGIAVDGHVFMPKDESLFCQDVSLPNIPHMELERQHREDLQMLRDRLDNLDNLQAAQLEELTSIAHSTLIEPRAVEFLEHCCCEETTEKRDSEKPKPTFLSS